MTLHPNTEDLHLKDYDKEPEVQPEEGVIDAPYIDAPLEESSLEEALPETDIDRRKFIMMAGVAAVVIALGGGAAWEAFGPKAPVKKEAQNDGNKATTRTETANTTSNPEKDVESYNTAMEKYKEMDIDSFEVLPRDEQLLYSQFLVDRTVSRRGYEARYGQGSRHSEFAVKPVKTASDNNGQQIVDGNLYVEQISFMQIGDNADGAYDATEGQKVLSLAYYTIGKGEVVTKDFVETRDMQNGESKPIALLDKLTATNTSDLSEGKNSQGEKVQYKIVTFYTEKAITLYDRFIYHEFTSYDGSRKGVWLLDAQSNSLENMSPIGSGK